MTGGSGEEIWEVWRRSITSTRELYESLDATRREGLRDAFVAYFERFRAEHGIEQPNPYLLILGLRR